MSKNIIAIDASSSAIGYAIFVEGELIDSGSIHVDQPYSRAPQERVAIVEEFFIKEMKEVIKNFNQKFGKHFKEVIDTLVLNLGYVQTNGVDEGVIALADVQSFIRHLFYYKMDFKYAPVLDISWIDALGKFVEYEGTNKELKVRKTKKAFTVKAAAKIKYGEWLRTALISSPHYLVGESDKMSDDEADAIFSGYAYMHLDIPRTTLLNRKEKIRIEKKDKMKKELNALVKKYNTIYGHKQTALKEIAMYEEKEKVNPSKVNQNAILTRTEKLKLMDEELKSIQEEGDKLQGKIKEI